MKITLISPIPSDIGLCTISSMLKSRGHLVRLLFVPELLEDCMKPLPAGATDRIIEFVGAADIIGINGLSENLIKTAALVDDLKNRIGTPIVWGGIHATLRPHDCIKHADIVCVGEGEEAMLELADKMDAGADTKDIKNLLFRSDQNSVKKVELRSPVDLDSLPSLDYDFNTQYVLRKNSIRNLAESDFGGVFFAYSSRSCPFRCSYCCNAAVNNMYDGHKFCRQRSMKNTFRELSEIKKSFSSCMKIWFNEADFLSGKTQKQIEEFSGRYKSEISIPFAIWSNPAAVNEENIRALSMAGLEGINIGTITGSDRIQREIYNRSALADQYIAKAEILKKHRVIIGYDIILCNPYEKDDDIIATINLLMRLPKPYTVFTHALAYFPGTELYERALRDGVIDEKAHAKSYRKAVFKVFRYDGPSLYLNIVLSMMRGRARRIRFPACDLYMLPDFMLKFLIKPAVVKFFNRLLSKKR